MQPCKMTSKQMHDIIDSLKDTDEDLHLRIDLASRSIILGYIKLLDLSVSWSIQLKDEDMFKLSFLHVLSRSRQDDFQDELLFKNPSDLNGMFMHVVALCYARSQYLTAERQFRQYKKTRQKEVES